jgi:CheY-like chemotaxis protein
VAHDFNNLLAVVLAYADLAVEALPEDHPARADVGEIRSAAARGASLTRQLLAFGRQQILQPRRVDLNAALGEVERTLRRVLPPEVALHVVPSPEPVAARVDPAQLQEAILHLVVNARDAMKGGGVVSVEPALRVVAAGDPSGAAPGPWATLTVRDGGAGMDAATRARAFEPFFTTKPTGEGTGLGLAMVHGFAAQSGGAGALESAPGQGTAVTLFLPPAPADVPAVTPARGLPAAGASPGATVLVVEDEAHVRRSIVRILERQGLRVIEARHGADALLAWDAAGGAVDAVVTDLVMPELGGRELVARLRARRPGLPVVVVSGYAGEAAPGGAPPIAAARHLEKPFEAAALVRAVLDALSGAR